MATIKNFDGSVGTISTANQYQMTNLPAKYRLLESYSSKKKFQPVQAGGISSDSKEIADTTHSNILNFLTKMQKFYFSPPSDNLWTIEIDAEDGENVGGIDTLYNNIKETNNNWSNVKFGTQWKVDMSSAANHGNTPEIFVKEFIGKGGVFLAQDIQFTPISANITDKPWNQGTNNQHFFNFGMAAHGRSDNKSLKISFLVSNWDIGDILFEPWIAAVAQKGLIEDDNSSIKSRIILKEYSHGMPIEFNHKKPFTKMECRKEYIFHKCVPVSRSEVKKDYEQNTAGQFKKTIVDFRFQDYEIKYLY